MFTRVPISSANLESATRLPCYPPSWEIHQKDSLRVLGLILDTHLSIFNILILSLCLSHCRETRQIGETRTSIDFKYLTVLTRKEEQCAGQRPLKMKEFSPSDTPVLISALKTTLINSVLHYRDKPSILRYRPKMRWRTATVDCGRVSWCLSLKKLCSWKRFLISKLSAAPD